MIPAGAPVAVVGGGYMGGGIAQTFAAHGFPTAVADASPTRTAELVAALHSDADRYVAEGLFPAGADEAVRANLRAATSLADAVAGAAYVAEAVPERIAVKDLVLRQICEYAPAKALIGTNTSAIPIGKLAASVTGVERFLGVHWMNPAPFIPCVELIATERTDPDTIAAADDLMRRLGKAPTVVADSPGFVANRLQYALLREAIRILEEGVAGVSEIDEVVKNSFGFRLPFFGPFAIADIAGLDVYRDSFATMERAYGERIGTPDLLNEMVAEGRYGLKSRQGFFRFDEKQADRVASFRDTAYARLSRLREEISPLELTEAEAEA
jgi:3-hydroxybutyryl-CoA dehydrogenase